MPIFEYKCDSCGRKFEVLEKSSAAVKKVCPECGSEKVSKQLSVFSPMVKQGESKKCKSCSDFSCPHSGH